MHINCIHWDPCLKLSQTFSFCKAERYPIWVTRLPFPIRTFIRLYNRSSPKWSSPPKYRRLMPVISRLWHSSSDLHSPPGSHPSSKVLLPIESYVLAKHKSLIPNGPLPPILNPLLPGLERKNLTVFQDSSSSFPHSIQSTYSNLTTFHPKQIHPAWKIIKGTPN